MGAVVGVLNESLTESIRGFYRLRRAYITLDSIISAEEKYLEARIAEASSPTGEIEAGPTLADAAVLPPGEEAVRIVHETAIPSPATPLVEAVQKPDEKQHDDPTVFSHPIDTFIHSGSSLCFGLLLLIISMVPPAFVKLLYIVGFKGDRNKGIELLWQASRSDDINGAMAGLTLMGYYNGFVGLADIFPNDSEGNQQGYPKRQCQQLLERMRIKYPKSGMWMVEEARMTAADGDLERSVQLLDTVPKSELRQLEALTVFEKSMNCMYLHTYEETAQSFLKVGGLFSSHSTTTDASAVCRTQQLVARHVSLHCRLGAGGALSSEDFHGSGAGRTCRPCSMLAKLTVAAAIRRIGRAPLQERS